MSSSPGISPLSSLLQTADVEGNPVQPGERVADVKAAHSIYRAMWLGDQQQALNRARGELVLAGYPPYDPEMLRATGQEGITNINTGLLKTYFGEACLPLIDQLNTVGKYVTLAIKIKPGDENDYEDFISIVEEEHYLLLMNEPTFSYRKIELIRQMVMHGISVPYFPDSYDWRWKSEPIGEFLIPHMTPATEDSVEVACMVRSRQPHELAQFLEKGNDDWNKVEIKQALRDAKPRNLKQGDWERYVDMWKGNDLWLTSQADEITTVEEFVTELDGSVSHYIFREDGQGNDYLYKKISRWKSQSEAYIFFTLDVATNGFFHSIRGLINEALPIVQEINRIFSGFMDAMRLSSKMALQADNEDALQNLTFIEHSGFLILPTGVKQAEKPMPGMTQPILAGLDYLSGFLNRKMSHFSSDDASFNNDSKRRTKAEIMAKMQQLASLGEGNTDLLNQSWERLIKSQLRKILRKGIQKEHPGGKQIVNFKKRCKDRGVPDEFWDMIDVERCSAEKAVGAGSAAQQIVVMERLMEAMEKGFFDAKGEQEFKKDYVRLYTNPEKAQRYVGDIEATRPLQDAKNAEFENQLMGLGGTVQVFDNDNNTVHAQIHIGQSNQQQPNGSLADDLNTLNQAVVQNDEDTILKIVPVMIQKHSHAADHVERMKDAAQAPQLRQQLQQIGGVIENAQKKAIHIQETRAAQAQKAQGQPGQPTQPGQPPGPGQQDQGGADGQDVVGGNYNLERQIVETQVKLKNNDAAAQQKLANDQRAADQKLQNEDRAAAQKLLLQHAQKVAAYQRDIAGS